MRRPIPKESDLLANGGDFFTASDGVEIYYNIWKAQNPKAIVLHFHGLGEHCHRYDHFFKKLVDAGLTVKAIDIRGHGRTYWKGKFSGKNVLLGYTENHEFIFSDMIQLAKMNIQEWEMPTFVFGHSMGGILAIEFTSLYADKITNFCGTICQAPALRPFNPPNFLIEFVATYLSFLYPTYTQPNNLKIEKLASDPAVVDAYLKDPFNHDRITLQLAGFILGAGSKWLKNPKAFKGPIFLYHSSKDEFTCYNSSKKFMDSIGSTDATFMTLESEFHELHNELGDTKWTIANDYVKWMLDRSKIRSKL